MIFLSHDSLDSHELFETSYLFVWWYWENEDKAVNLIFPNEY